MMMSADEIIEMTTVLRMDFPDATLHYSYEDERHIFEVRLFDQVWYATFSGVFEDEWDYDPVIRQIKKFINSYLYKFKKEH